MKIEDLEKGSMFVLKSDYEEAKLENKDSIFCYTNFERAIFKQGIEVLPAVIEDGYLKVTEE